MKAHTVNDRARVSSVQELHKEDFESMTNIPMTVAGAEALRNELKRLKSEDRPRIIQAIADAR